MSPQVYYDEVYSTPRKDRDAIVTDAFSFNGNDSILYDGSYSNIVSLQNRAKAYVYCFSVNASYTFAPQTSIDGVFTYTDGTYTNAGNAVSFDHIPPVYGRFQLTY